MGRIFKRELEERVRAILNAIVGIYIRSADPVGSRTLSKTLGLELSPATIRNVMADLIEQGYLDQPHASAGRVPTDKAYRYYVDTVVCQSKLPHGVRVMIDIQPCPHNSGREWPRRRSGVTVLRFIASSSRKFP